MTDANKLPAAAIELHPVSERREGWGMAIDAVCHVVYPQSAADVLAAFDLARARGWTVAHWGGGRSYGDAALNDSNLLLDFRDMNRILKFDRDTGVAVVEPGVTLQKLWHHILPLGWWPAVVSGTMYTTLGGLCAANAHGKNNHKYGPIGDHVLGFTLVCPDGEIRECSREQHPDIFHAAIGGMGWLGTFVSITIQTKAVHSGRLSVTPIVGDDIGHMFRLFRRYNDADYDYVVGWIDAYAKGADIGRGQIHAARYVEEGQDPVGRSLMRPEDQTLPPNLFGILPFSLLHWFARPLANRWGMWLVNWGRYQWMALRESAQHTHLQEHARFNFLLDFVPNWKWFTAPGGLIQFQLFLPESAAEGTIRRVLADAQYRALEPYLVVMKRHRSDAFWLSHAVDGYSFAMDFFVKDHTREELYRFTQHLQDLVVDCGGRFYFAKDSVVSGDAVRKSLGDETVGRFMALKARLDPDNLMRGNQFRRIFGAVPKQLDTADDIEPPAAKKTKQKLTRKRSIRE